MEKKQKLMTERTQLFTDIYDGRIPRRIPRMSSLSPELAIQYAGLPLGRTQYTLEGIEEAFDKVCRLDCFDAYPMGFFNSPLKMQILGSRSFIMGSNGFMQHPEVVPMEPDEYDELIASPIDFYLEKIQPRVYSELDTDPVTRSLVFSAAINASRDHMDAFKRINDKLAEKYGFYSPPEESGAMTFAPFDYLADWLRGFTGASTDIRRYPEKVTAACEAILPLVFHLGLPPVPSCHGETVIPLHMAPYMRTKDFKKFYWPTLYKLVWALAEAGQPVQLACEHDWMRYLDYLQELPAGTRFIFEFGDPQLVKDKLGKKFIILGFYPLILLKTGSKEQCIDKAKELLDILAPGGNYIFAFDKGAVSLDSINLDNYVAVMNYVAENSAYGNAGENSLVCEKTNPPRLSISSLKSKYELDWEEYKLRHPEIIPELEPIIKEQLTQYRRMVLDFLLY